MIRPLRGQVVIRELSESRSSVIWRPDDAAKNEHTHRGLVVAMGPPSLVCTTDSMGRCTSLTCSHCEVPHYFEIGDVVQYHIDFHQAAMTNEWEGVPAIWVPQRNVDAVIEGAEVGSFRGVPKETEELRSWAR